MNILRTDKSSIISGSSNIFKLASIDYPLRAIAIDWLNAVTIWLWMLANHHKLLILYRPWILLWLSGWSCNKTKFPSEISSNFWLNLAALFCLLCQMLLNACLFAAPTNSYCCWIHDSFETDSLQLYWDNSKQLSQGVWALQPNINWYGWYPVVEWGVALYINTKASRWGGQLGFWSLGSFFSKFTMCYLISHMVNFHEDYMVWW